MHTHLTVTVIMLLSVFKCRYSDTNISRKTRMREAAVVLATKS